ncbi:hypothetical protein ACQVUL_20670 [Bacillus cytotoxicus]|uniref:Uncharacterized protein n=1 Tax=Bacillus cytotoxicus (strain DSM 22905 / CIP 110041 / 391-98 / NVH 391-98) TaxID=315749 RepID=A7GVQ5_BACCN|nr:hypothetical protein [Bacillus cytotoxicus]ABS24213.1 hypothetical protein Bcer98_4032 [Bacillus cytotoxicus NVH 391-98]QTR73046.1 hypothetical protein JC775_20355 [Bacillus cytotoxicus]QTR81104.1 hypothetical protein JC777_00080 [Bacillus cytotoxicus]QTR85208.1 hypothetical protein JC774_00080 [Bacillus cytotoxicus]HDR4573535.1 hypothetical protein [Bacillus cytotoxicus]
MEDLLHKIIDQLDKISKDIEEIKIDLKAHRIETDDNFNKLYHLVEEKDVEIDVLNKRLFKNEATVERIKREKH